MVNSYAELSGHYDRIMTSGYYDYDDYARTLLALLPDRPHLLELGTGTGLVVEKVLELADAAPGAPAAAPHITGIDHTESMLAQARARVGERARFVRQDILHLDMPAQFDAAFSVGGVWYHTPSPEPEPEPNPADGTTHDGTLLCSHLLEDEDNIRALRNVHAALRPGGVLVLARQAAHHDYERDLPDGLVYAQAIRRTGAGRYVKDYYVKRGSGEVVAHQRCQYRTYPEARAIGLLKDCGFRAERVSDNGLLHLYTRV
ncbi:methyltransferase domain-containing protein [Streptomyces sp. p1417]|uniref:Methyltransferase domain-containing protein n=1 Tax=Streptomyces typhae TaxID=2681492 RepID=A0A6L6WQN3_9ACTN|nr:class I SAM-dependent methyltransferase [Streptomyces typhae]MVO84582.1 methyltransferase domain-containing protein [Streptomyces typhae]